MKAGTKKRPMAARAQRENKAQIQREFWRFAGLRNGRAIGWVLESTASVTKMCPWIDRSSDFNPQSYGKVRGRWNSTKK